MTELSGKKYQVAYQNQTYTFGICTGPKDPCLENAGACLTSKGQSSSMGVTNDELILPGDGGAPYLLYESGSVCEALHQKWSTKIEFICQREDMAAGPKIIENTNCSLIIQFATKKVCRNDVSA